MSPRTTQQFQEIREDKMALIMDVALQHFASEGYFRTTISHLARHAGISKGLMYNYFESKEALLKAIIHKSVNEIFRYLDMNRDGVLSEEEFEFFIRKVDVLLNEKRYFWRLLLQLFVQNDVREQFFKAFPESDSLIHPGHEPGDNYYPFRIMKLLRGYFNRKSQTGDSHNSADFEMFMITLSGYAIRTIYSGVDHSEGNGKSIDRIIEMFK